MIKLKSAVIVEGKYDKITLENIIDTLIITTNGFSLFRDNEKRELIRTLAQKDGIIVMTDSDSAGRMIRSHIKQICPKGTVTNVYIPKIYGKEKRKEKAGKEKLLGVEGMSVETIKNALIASGVTLDEYPEKKEKITKTELFSLGLSGCENSSAMRQKLSTFLGIPTGFSPNGFLDLINTLYEKKEFFEKVKKWQQEADKN